MLVVHMFVGDVVEALYYIHIIFPITLCAFTLTALPQLFSPCHAPHSISWDTAGADRFKGVTTAYFRGAQGKHVAASTARCSGGLVQ